MLAQGKPKLHASRRHDGLRNVRLQLRQQRRLWQPPEQLARRRAPSATLQLLWPGSLAVAAALVAA
ncbi:MAG: hypothetical protein ACKPKO_25375, partial [Candidatus Fonsibacter sp.]